VSATRQPDRETQNIATAIADISERAQVLVREEIELAKAEMAQKASRLARGTIVGLVAGVFFFTALMFVLIGCAYLLYYYLPIGNENTFFYGFFAMAIILIVLGAFAGLVAARALKKGSPPVPTMAIEEAQKIRDTVGHSDAPPDGAAFAAAAAAPPPPPAAAAAAAAPPPPPPAATAPGPSPAAEAADAEATEVPEPRTDGDGD
jgi:Putative Actinobacterial Holin-X, holin superfamily III